MATGTPPHESGPPDDRRCTARSKRKDERCGAWAVTGKHVCYHHGACSTGAGDAARPGNQNAVLHGLYSQLVSEGMVKQAELLDGFDPIERKRMLAALLEVRTLRALANEQAPLAAVGAAVKQVSESLSGGGLNDADDADDRDIESLDPGQLAARIDAQIKASRGGPA